MRKTAALATALIGGFAAVGAAAVSAPWFDLEPFPPALYATMAGAGLGLQAHNVVDLTDNCLMLQGYARALRAAGLTLKRQESLAETAQTHDSQRKLLLISLAELQDGVERAAAPELLGEQARYAASERASAEFGRRRPSQEDFRPHERPVRSLDAADDAKLKPGRLEFKQR